MKHRDARVFALCQHLRSAIDVLEQIASVPFQIEEAHPAPPTAPFAPPPVDLPPEKLAYTLREAAAAVGVGRTTLYKAMADGKLLAVKLGTRNLIPAEALRQWLAGLPRSARSRSRRSSS